MGRKLQTQIMEDPGDSSGYTISLGEQSPVKRVASEEWKSPIFVLVSLRWVSNESSLYWVSDELSRS